MSEENNHTDLLARWLNNDLSEEEQKYFHKNAEFDDLKTVVDDIDSWTVTPLDLDRGFSKIKTKNEKSQPEAKVISMAAWFRVAASVALLMVAYAGWDYFLNTEVLIQTSIGEKQEIELPDGSMVTLDASSSLAYVKRDWSENREVEITGQAYLDVESGGSFVLNTSLGTVSVLGTQFNVKVGQVTFDVRCYEGKVEVVAGSQKEILLANEGTKLQDDQLIRYSVQGDLDWINGITSYAQAPLSQVIVDLQKYYQIEVNLPNQYEGMRFTGQFTHGDVELALRSVFATMEIEYTLSDGKVVFH